MPNLRMITITGWVDDPELDPFTAVVCNDNYWEQQVPAILAACEDGLEQGTIEIGVARPARSPLLRVRRSFQRIEPILVLMATPNQRDGKRVLKKVVVTHRRDYAHAYSMFAVPQRGRLNQVEKRCIAEMLFPMLSKMGILSLED